MVDIEELIREAELEALGLNLKIKTWKDNIKDLKEELNKPFNPINRHEKTTYRKNKINDNISLLLDKYNKTKEFANGEAIIIECSNHAFEILYKDCKELKNNMQYELLERNIIRLDKRIRDVYELIELRPKNKIYHVILDGLLTSSIKIDHCKQELIKLSKEEKINDKLWLSLKEEEMNKEEISKIEEYLNGLMEGKNVVYNIRSKLVGKVKILARNEIGTIGEFEELSELLELPNYLPIKKIGEGATRKVYKVVHEQRDHILALKIEKDEKEITNPRSKLIAQQHGDNLSKRERLALMDLTHENLARMWDFGNNNGRNYIVEEYVEGKTLEQMIREKGKLNAKELILIFAPIIKATRYLREKGYVHRDIKPDNILISNDFNIIKLTDLQNAVKINESETYIGKSFGSIRTMAPEVILEGKASFSSDLYSIGVCMYYTITGEYPFDYVRSKENKTILKNKKNGMKRKLNEIDLPQDLKNLIEIFLLYKPEDRSKKIITREYTGHGYWRILEECYLRLKKQNKR